MIQTLRDPLFADKKIQADTLRLDLMHPGVSGNKWYKLKYYLADAKLRGCTGIVSFGGAYSNHLVALAVACAQNNFSCTAIIRGNDPGMENPSLIQMQELGMNILFVARKDYRNKESLLTEFLSRNPGYCAIPEGGSGPMGIRGASEINALIGSDYSDILCAVGTGTTMAGLINGALPHQHVTGICVLKTGDDKALQNFLRSNSLSTNYTLRTDFHGGGYAKKEPSLIAFMNRLYSEENIPSDFIYTGKLFAAAHALAREDYFPPGSKIIVIHSGGLQGNRSLQEGVLEF